MTKLVNEVEYLGGTYSFVDRPPAPEPNAEPLVSGLEITDVELKDMRERYAEFPTEESGMVRRVQRRLDPLVGLVGHAWPVPASALDRADLLDAVDLLVPKLQEYADKLRNAA